MPCAPGSARQPRPGAQGRLSSSVPIPTFVSFRGALESKGHWQIYDTSEPLYQCRLFEVPTPRAANSIQELQIESGTRINMFASAHDFPKFVNVGAAT